MPWRFTPGPLGAIRKRFAGWNLQTGTEVLFALLEFSQSRLRQPCFFGQFQLSSRLSEADPRPFGHGRDTPRHPFLWRERARVPEPRRMSRAWPAIPYWIGKENGRFSPKEGRGLATVQH